MLTHGIVGSASLALELWPFPVPLKPLEHVHKEAHNIAAVLREQRQAPKGKPQSLFCNLTLKWHSITSPFLSIGSSQ